MLKEFMFVTRLKQNVSLIITVLCNEKLWQGPGKGFFVFVFLCGAGFVEKSLAERVLCETCAVKGAIK